MSSPFFNRWLFLGGTAACVVLIWYYLVCSSAKTEPMSMPEQDSNHGDGDGNGKSTDDKFYWSKPDTRQLTCVIAGANGQRYCVRDTKNKQAAASLLGTVVTRCTEFVQRLAREHPHHPVAIRLRERFEPERMMESLPNSEFTAFSENKGEKIALCLTPKKDDAAPNAPLIDDHTLTFVALHELAHVGTVSTEDHGPDFWRNFAFLLFNAQEQGIHDPVDYRTHPVKYCSMQINDNPLFSRGSE